MYGRGFSGRAHTSACAAKMLVPLALGAACIAFSPAGAGEAGAQPGGPRATASQGQGAANEAKSVNASSLPKLNPSETSRMLQPPHPRGSLNEEEYNAAKAAAARRGAAPWSPCAAARKPTASWAQASLSLRSHSRRSAFPWAAFGLLAATIGEGIRK